MGSVAAAFLALVGTLIATRVQYDNYKKQNKIADENLQLEKDNLEYQKEIQQKVFDREDNSYQRARADLEKAGFNPNIINGGAGVGSVVSTSAPQRQQVSAGGLSDAIKHLTDPIDTYTKTKQAELIQEQTTSQMESNKQSKIKTATDLLTFAKENGLSADINYLEGIPYVTVGTDSKPYQSGYLLDLEQKNANLNKTRLQMDIDSQKLELDRINSNIAKEKNQLEAQKLKQQATQAQNDIDYKYHLLDFNKELERLRVNSQISLDDYKKILIDEQIKASKTERHLKIFNTVFGSIMKTLGISMDAYKAFKPSSGSSGSKIFGRNYD